MYLMQFPQGCGGEDIRQGILALEATVWPPEEGERFPSAPETYVTSFVLLDSGRVICHAAVRRSPLVHKGQRYMAYGLSEVVTHPQYRGRGLASRVLERARSFILEQGADIVVFTCQPELAGFYARAGWQCAQDAVLVGGTRDAPFRSDGLGLATMLTLLSAKARLHRRDFAHADIFCELGERQLW